MYSAKLNILFKQSQILIKDLRLFCNEGELYLYLGNNQSNEIKLDFSKGDYTIIHREIGKLFPNNQKALEGIYDIFEEINNYRNTYKGKAYIKVEGLDGLISTDKHNIDIGDIVKVIHDFDITEHTVTDKVNIGIEQIKDIKDSYKVTRVKFKSLKKELYEIDVKYNTIQRPSVLYALQIEKIIKKLKEESIWTEKTIKKI